MRTTGASRLFEQRVPAADAEVARRLKQAGAILLGKLNLHEFAYGGSSTVTAFGTMQNPWRRGHVTGGSSGGPGVAVAAGLCYASLGTDTAGSIRMPASHCGIVGLKPTYGRVSTRGVMTLSWTLDHVGPMCRTVEDTALMLNVVAGYDAADPTTANVPIDDYTRALRTPTARLRVGLPERAFFDNLDVDVADAVQEALGVIEQLVAGTTDIDLPPTGAPNRVWAPEALAYHAKWLAESPDKYQPGTRQALLNAKTADAAQYVLAVREVEQARRDIVKTFSTVDVLITPDDEDARTAARRRTARRRRQQQRRVRHLRAPDDLRALRLLEAGIADWALDQRRAVGREHGAGARRGVRTRDGLARSGGRHCRRRPASQPCPGPLEGGRLRLSRPDCRPP